MLQFHAIIPILMYVWILFYILSFLILLIWPCVWDFSFYCEIIFTEIFLMWFLWGLGCRVISQRFTLGSIRYRGPVPSGTTIIKYWFFLAPSYVESFNLCSKLLLEFSFLYDFFNIGDRYILLLALISCCLVF